MHKAIEWSQCCRALCSCRCSSVSNKNNVVLINLYQNKMGNALHTLHYTTWCRCKMWYSAEGVLFEEFKKIYELVWFKGYCTPGSYFWRLCAFPQKIKQLRTKYPMDLVRNVPRNSKITVLLRQRPLLWSYSEKCVKINIFHVLSHKSITTWVSEIPVQ